MRIGVDLWNVTLGESGGLAQLLQGAFERLIPTDPENQYIAFGTLLNNNLLRVFSPNYVRVTLPSETYKSGLQDWIDQDGAVDVLFRGYPLDDRLNFPPTRQVVCIPDSQHDVYPQNFSAAALKAQQRLFRYYQRCAGAIGTLTNFTRDALLADRWTDCRDVFLMPPGLPLVRVAPADAESRRLVPEGRFFLYPANLWPHKNHRLVLQAFARFHEKHKDVRFVFTGHPDGWKPLQAEFGWLPIKHLGFIAPEVLAALYRRALALVFLSRFEGFGIPLLEAFDAGLPVLCSNVAALPEVGADAVLSCDPTSVEEMAAGMVRIAGDRELRSALIERGKSRLGAYTWSGCAAALKDAFERVDANAAARLPVQVADLPLVSIVTPSFNQGVFIKRTIDSVLGQDYPHIEYLVVDGASTDETLDVLRSYGDRARWISEKDRGQAHAINKGMAQAKGDILAYLNSDDVLRPGAVSRVVEYFRKRPACDLVYGRDAFIDADDRYMSMFPTAPYSFENLLNECCISQPAAFWRARIARIAGEFDESLHLVLDYEYWMRIDRKGGVLEYLPEILASTRVHPATKTNYGVHDRERFFGEVFAISLKHAGYISRDYLYHYACQCLAPPLQERWPVLRGCHKELIDALMIWARYRHQHRCRPVGCHARTFKDALPIVLSLLRGNWDWMVDRLKGRPIPQPDRVHWGPCRPNFLGHRAKVPPLRERCGDELFLRGRAACDTVLSIYAGKDQLAEIPLRAQQDADLRIVCPPEKADRPLEFHFSSSIRCSARGEYAMEVYGTNLFRQWHVRDRRAA